MTDVLDAPTHQFQKRATLKGHGYGHASAGVLLRGKDEAHRLLRVGISVERVDAIDVSLRPSPVTTVSGLEGFNAFAYAAAEVAVSELGLGTQEVRAKRRSGIVVSRGHGSACADALAMVRAVCMAADHELGDDDASALVAQAARAVGGEHSGAASRGITIIDEQTGRIAEPLTWWPRFHVVTVVSDAAHDEAPFSPPSVAAADVSALLSELQAAARARDELGFARVGIEHARLLAPMLPGTPVSGLELALDATDAIGAAVSPLTGALALLFPHTPAGQASGSRASYTMSQVLGTQVRSTMTKSRPESQ